MGFSRQEYWSGLLFPSPGDLPDWGIEAGSPALQADCSLSEPPGKPPCSADLMFKSHQNPVDLKQAQMHSPVTLALHSILPPRDSREYLPAASWVTNALTLCSFSPWLIPYQALLLICITGFSDRSGEMERRISHFFTERRQRLRKA